MQKLTAQEKEAMIALWKLGKATARQIQQMLDKPRPNYSTLRSTLDNLKEKNYLRVIAIGNTNVYDPLIKEAVFKKKFLAEIVKDHFANSYKEVVAFFVRQNKITEQDIEEIIDIIRNKKVK